MSDLEADFTKAFTDRFDVTAKTKQSLNNMDTVLKEQVIHGFKEGLDKRKSLNIAYFEPSVSGIPGGDMKPAFNVIIECDISRDNGDWTVVCRITIEFDLF